MIAMKRYVFSLAVALLAAGSAHAQMYIQRSNLNTRVLKSNRISFKKKADAERWSYALKADGGYLPAFDISSVARIYIPQTPQEEALAKYVGPTYADDYRSVNGWNMRAQWNLANVHDPSVMRAADGYYYMYQTDAGYGNSYKAGGGHFLCRRSKDMVHWEVLGTTMPKVPVWLKDTLNSIRAGMGLPPSNINFADDDAFGYWAPCVRKVTDGLYRMYYVITCPGTLTNEHVSKVGERSFIGLMETATPSDCHSWVDRGMVLTQYSDQGLNWAGKSQWGGYYRYNAIDPSYIITPEGEHWLIYGSWHSGFPAVKINPSTGKTLQPLGRPWGAAHAAGYGKRVFTRYANNRWQASEAPEVVYRNGYYYLFVAFDELGKCYNTRVLRSKHVDGPYLDITGTDFTNGTTTGNVYPILTHPYRFGADHGWVGISHCAVWNDGEDHWYYSSQQRFPQNYKSDANANAIMMGGVRRILWTEEGWPLVLPERYGHVPQVPITEDELLGEWQNVTLNYIAGTDGDSKDHMDQSVSLTLNPDHTVSGSIFSGRSWSYDAAKQVLHIGTIGLYLARETDWESGTRHATIVYAGYGNGGRSTYWGKRVSAPQAEASSTEAKILETVGSTDNSTAWWTAFSGYQTAESGQCEVHYTFVNHTDKINNWDNWAVVVTNGRQRGASGYKEYVVLRADAYGWQGAMNTNDNSKGWFRSLTNNYNWSTFKADMDGAMVDMTIRVDGGTLTIDARTTTVGDKVYTMSFAMPVENGSKGVFLTCEKAHLEVTEATVTAL